MGIKLETVVGLVGLGLLAWLCLRLFLPFLAPLVWALAIGTALRKPYQRLLKSMRGRPNLAAAVAVLGVMLAIVMPVLVVGLVLFGEINRWYSVWRDRVATSGLDPLAAVQEHPVYRAVEGRLRPLLEKAGLEVDVRSTLLNIADSARGILVDLVSGFAAGAGELVLDFGLMLVAMFFVFRDGHVLAVWVERLSPLGAENDRLIAERFNDVTAATLLGTVATGVAQGTVGTLLFWVLGVPNPALWGATMVFMSFVPIVGAAVVWVPAALYLWFGQMPIRAALLVAGGVLLIGTVDNVVKPLVMGPRAGLHPLLVLFAVFGGLQLYGLTGVVLGPMLVALLLTFAQIYRERYADQLRSVPDAPDAAGG